MPADFKNRPTVNGVGVALQGEVGGANVAVLASDVVNNNATANTLADVTGLSFAVNANQLYRFEFLIAFDAAATTTGARFTLNGPTFSRLVYAARITTAAGATSFRNQSAYNSGTPTTDSMLTGNLAELVGFVRPTAAGTIQLRFSSEVASSAITVRADSNVQWWQI